MDSKNAELYRRFPAPDIVPSLYSANHGALREAAVAAVAGGACQLHVDVMDGSFVPLIGLSFKLIEELHTTLTGVFLHVHLMTNCPFPHAQLAIAAGAASVIFRIETTAHSEALLRNIREKGVAAGIALNPATPPEALRYLTHLLDIVLIMTVNPGRPD